MHRSIGLYRSVQCSTVQGTRYGINAGAPTAAVFQFNYFDTAAKSRELISHLLPLRCSAAALHGFLSRPSSPRREPPAWAARYLSPSAGSSSARRARRARPLITSHHRGPPDRLLHAPPGQPRERHRTETYLGPSCHLLVSGLCLSRSGSGLRIFIR